MDQAAERAVLAGLCTYGFDAYVDVSDFLSTDCFSSEFNQIVYNSLEHLFLQTKSKVDYPSILNAATVLGYKTFIQSNEDVKFIRSLFEFPIEQENIRGFALKLRKLKAINDGMLELQMTKNELSKLSGEEKFSEIISVTEDRILEFTRTLGERENKTVPMGFNAHDYILNLGLNPTESLGIPTPFLILNKVLGGGLVAGGYSMIVARPKTGKSTLASNIELGISLDLDIPCLMVDTEMARELQLARRVSTLSRVPIDLVRTGQYYQYSEYRDKVLDSAKRIENCGKLHYHNTRGESFEETLSSIRRWIYRNVGFQDNGHANPCVVIYDYFRLNSSGMKKDMKEYEALGFQASALHDFFAKYNVSGLAFVQSNRDGIDDEHDGIVAQSDRLSWSCISLSIFKRKCKEDYERDGYEQGNRKIIQLYSRNSAEIDTDHYINYKLNGEFAQIVELGMNNAEIKKSDPVEF